MINFSELPEDGVKFEQLIRELFVSEGYETHWTGVGPDQGRDLIVLEKMKGPMSEYTRKWLIECKHYARSNNSVGLHNINSIVSACEAVGAEGFLLACSTQPSSSLVRHLEEIQQNNSIITLYWDSIEIEKRLYRPKNFHLVELFLPESSRESGWKIYNSLSPSFWAAHYKDYFLYLSSRDAVTFPDLEDVEEIVKKIEIFEVHDRQYLRPRAVYFDNKHENFSVFIDYIVPRDEEEENIIKPSEFNEHFEDGQGLYSEGNVMWYITNWDIRLVKAFQYSDHFHLDHKNYYEPFIDSFKVGLDRDGFLSDLVYSGDQFE